MMTALHPPIQCIYHWRIQLRFVRCLTQSPIIRYGSGTRGGLDFVIQHINEHFNLNILNNSDMYSEEIVFN